MSNRLSIIAIVVFLFLAGVIISCSESDETQSTTKQTPCEESISNSSSPLNDSYWILSEINGQSVDDSCRYELHFHNLEGNRLSCHNCCNNCGAHYQIGQQSFSVIEDTFSRNHFTSGQRGCSEDIIKQEDAYFDALLSTTNYRYQENDLVFINSNGDTVLVYYAKPKPLIDPNLINTQWNLISLNGIPPLEDTYITVGFNDKSMGGHGGLNSYGVTLIQAYDGVIIMDGPLLSTSMGTFGNGGRGEQEGKYLNMLRNANRYRITSDNLEISTTNNEGLTYEKDPEGFRFPVNNW